MSGRIEAITGQGRHPVHRRLRPCLPLHHQRHHQERRRHGAGLPRRRAAQGHGVRPVPSHRPAVHRHPHHRGGARSEGGYLINKDGYRYLQDYNLGKPEPKPVLAQHGAGAARPPVAGLRQGAGEGADHRHAVRPRRPPRPPPSGREDHQHQDAVRARAVPEVPEHRSGQGADPGAAGRPLHDGRRPHRHPRRHAAARALRRRRGRLRQHQRRQPAGLEFAARAAGLRRPRRASGGRVRVEPEGARCGGAGPGRGRAAPARPRLPAARPTAASASPRVRDEMQKTMEESAGIYRTGAGAGRGRRPARRSCEERIAASASTTTAGRSTPSSIAALELPFMLDVAERHGGLGAQARGIARRAPAHRLPRARRRSASSRIRCVVAPPTARAGSSTYQ